MSSSWTSARMLGYPWCIHRVLVRPVAGLVHSQMMESSWLVWSISNTILCGRVIMC